MISELPGLFHRLPLERRQRIVRVGWGPAGACWLKPRVEGKIAVSTGHEIVAARANGSRIALKTRSADGQTEFEADHVISATGFQTDVRRVPYLDAGLRNLIHTIDGAPALDHCLQSSVPGLFFAGMASAQSFGPVMRFMFGAKHAAPKLARVL
jgi:hypothetical protein